MTRLTLISILTLCLLGTFFSCQQGDQKSANVPMKDSLQWNVIEIHLDKQSIRIKHDADTASFLTWDEKDSVERPGVVAHVPINLKDTAFIIKENERDSLAKYIYDALQHPVFTDRHVTCYVGNIYFRIKKGNTSLSCSYYSVGDWTDVSPTVGKIYKLLRSKIKISKY